MDLSDDSGNDREFCDVCGLEIFAAPNEQRVVGS